MEPKTNRTRPFGQYSQGNRNDRICRRLLVRELADNPCNRIAHVLDVGDDPFYWKHDIDLVCVGEDLRYSTVEIKADNYPPLQGVKKLFLEFVSNDKQYILSSGKNGIGCILYTRADFLVFYFIKQDMYLTVPSTPLKAFVHCHLVTEKYQVRSCATTGADGKVLYNSYGLIVPVPDILNGISSSRLVASQYRYRDIEKETD